MFPGPQRSYIESVMRGFVPGASSFSSNGHYTSGAAVADAPVHNAGVVNVTSAAGVKMSFVSTSAQDGPAGTGILSLAMSYIEAVTFASKTEIITLNGTTPVLSVATNIRFINSLTMLSSGTAVTGKAVGTITASNGGVTYGQILVGTRTQESSYRMVPTGKVFVPHIIVASSNSGTAAAQCIFHIVSWSDVLPFWIPSNAIGCQDGPIIIPLGAGRAISSGGIIGIEFTADKAAQVTASLIGHIENTY